MKRILFLLLIMILVAQALTAEPAWQTPRVWYENDASNNASNRKNVINLESLFYLPTMDTTYNSNTPNGTYSSVNSLGNFGCAYCNHEITFTISTTGKFVSESDPTKYRDFYVAVMPRVRYDTQDRKNPSIDDHLYCMDRTYQGGELAGAVMAPNTRDVSGQVYKTISITAPPVSFSEYTKYYVGPDGDQHVFRFWGDLLICLPALTQEDLQHMSESDDYTATVTVSWSCTGEGECNANHNGSFQFNLRGYYKNAQNSQDSLAMFVTPTYSSMNLDIRSILADDPAECQISQLKIYTTTAKKSNNTWARYSGNTLTSVRVKPFISANSFEFWNQNRNNTFALKSGNTLIPFTVIVRDPENDDQSWTFDGSDYWGKENMSVIDLSNYLVTVRDRQGNEYNMLSFTGDVYISFEDQTIPGNLPSGIYSEDIYYYIGYN